MDSALFRYAIDPSSIDYSVGPDRLSVVDLTLTATNETSADVTCSSIALTLSVGAGQGALTEDARTVAASPGDATPWAVGGGDGTWTAVPLPPVTVVPAGASVQFVLADVIVNDAQGPSDIGIVEVTDATRSGQVTVKKSAPTPAGTTPTIPAFTATPAIVALGEVSTLSWQVTDAQRLVLGPGAVDLPPVSGSLPVAVDATTTYTLDAIAAGGRASAVTTVTVGSVAIESFTATPDTPVTAGAPVTLQWSTRSAARCSIDQGVGIVPVSGSAVVTPQRTTVYTLTALGLNPRETSVTVTVST